MKKLYAYQEEGVAKMIADASGFANFAEMGCGKTAMTITAAHRLNVYRVLIVCPNTLKYNWQDEWAEWMPQEWDFFVIDGSPAKRTKTMKKALTSHRATAIAVNYDVVDRMVDELTAFRPDLIIADEMHNIKNHKSKRGKALKKIPTKFKFGLTGTPQPNNPLDIWSQFDWIRPGYLGKNYYVFRAVYADVYTGAGFPMIKGYKNLDRLQQLISRYSYRVTKDEALDLPDKIYQTVHVEMNDKTKKVYESLRDECVAEVGDNEIIADTALVRLVRFQQLTSGFLPVVEGMAPEVLDDAKLEALCEIADAIPNDKIVIWARFNLDIDRIREKMEAKDRGRKVFVMRGDVPNDVRAAQVKEFEEKNGRNDVMILNLQVGGVGITLVQARYVIYYSRNFSLGDDKQSQDRTHRIGQQHKVTYYDLVCKNTIDEFIVKKLQAKEALARKITGDDLRRILGGVA